MPSESTVAWSIDRQNGFNGRYRVVKMPARENPGEDRLAKGSHWDLPGGGAGRGIGGGVSLSAVADGYGLSDGDRAQG